jgi:prepilin-type N-terminal cleavage/methylation domain-containing protein
MRSTDRSARQRGYSLFEVMAASLVLSVLVAGITGLYAHANTSVGDVVMRQKAVLVLGSEMERLTALYMYTNFGVAGPSSTDTYESTPTTRSVYPSSVSTYVTGTGNDFMTTSAATFATSDFLVWRKSGGSSNLDRTYVWIDRDRNQMARLSWTTTDIVTATCTYESTDCRCFGYSGVAGSRDNCRVLTLYVEYPYFYSSSGTATAATRLRTLTLKTIVGRA